MSLAVGFNPREGSVVIAVASAMDELVGSIVANATRSSVVCCPWVETPRLNSNVAMRHRCNNTNAPDIYTKKTGAHGPGQFAYHINTGNLPVGGPPTKVKS